MSINIKENLFQFEHSFADLPDGFYTKLAPSKVNGPELLFFNEDLANQLGLNYHGMDEAQLALYFSGNELPDNAKPLAQAYAGHQFGHFAILGDGRAHLLGEHITSEGARFDIQLKGSGQTPYSRQGDGRAALGPMLREYLISEAMAALHIPTTRSLAVVLTNQPVYREQPLQGAILTRVASSVLRVGHFELCAAKYRAGHKNHGLKALMDYTIWRHYSHIKDDENAIFLLLKAVMERQIDLIVNWMRVGFIHGVMNSDNMSLSGETIDYGPCAFMDIYDPKTVFSSIDHAGRYHYQNQPLLAQWNLARFAESLIPLCKDENKALERMEEILHDYTRLYAKKYLQMMRGKLGLSTDAQYDEQDMNLIKEFLDILHQEKQDFTNGFLALDPTNTKPKHEYLKSWHQKWHKRIGQNKHDYNQAKAIMTKHNPAIIPRNHLVEKALKSADRGDLTPFKTLLSHLQTPYENGPDKAPFQLPPNDDERIYHTFCGT